MAQDVTRVLERAVPFDGAGLLTVDPATLLPTGLPTGELVEHGIPPEVTSRFIEIELREPDFNKFRALVRQGRPAASLSEATKGDLEQSLRHRELCRLIGFDDEVRVVCADSTGAWGDMILARAPRGPRFDATEVHFLASIAPLLAECLRRAAILDEVATGDQSAACVVVLAPDNTVDTATPGARHLLAVAARARRLAGDCRNDRDDGREPRSDTFARARVRTSQGNWVTVRGSVLGDGPDPSVAVLMEQSHAPELAPLIADAYGLTDRERRVTELVAQGFATNDIGQRLHLSAYTVQDHLKSIFDKTGAGSRGELVARLFFDHYAPRLASQTTNGVARRRAG
jgi:DNA-binding CsgD family transcriptional regulator